MALYRFKQGDVIKNVIKTHPRQSFYIYDGVVHSKELFPETTLPIYSFITKDGSKNSFKTVTTEEYNSDFTYGDTITGSSISFFSSSLSRYFYNTATRPIVTKTLRNTYDYYSLSSPHYQYSSSLGNKEIQDINIISVPSIFYGSSIRRGTVDMKFFVSGSLVGELRDERQNGELVQVGPYGSNGSGSVAGVCFYREGVISLTGSWTLGEGEGDYTDAGADLEHKWIYYGAGIEDSFGSGVLPYSSFEMSFEGKQNTSTITLMCHADRGELNYSNNPTYVKRAEGNRYVSSSNFYKELDAEIANITYSPYLDPTGSFQKTTYISKVFVYDDNMNIVAVAKLARPVKKVEDREFTIKLRMDV